MDAVNCEKNINKVTASASSGIHLSDEKVGKAASAARGTGTRVTGLNDLCGSEVRCFICSVLLHLDLLSLGASVCSLGGGKMK